MFVGLLAAFGMGGMDLNAAGIGGGLTSKDMKEIMDGQLICGWWKSYIKVLLA